MMLLLSAGSGGSDRVRPIERRRSAKELRACLRKLAAEAPENERKQAGFLAYGS